VGEVPVAAATNDSEHTEHSTRGRQNAYRDEGEQDRAFGHGDSCHCRNLGVGAEPHIVVSAC
jgi:hypothetical protein